MDAAARAGGLETATRILRMTLGAAQRAIPELPLALRWSGGG